MTKDHNLLVTFRKSLIETEYRITAKPSTSGNPMSNTVLERIHQVLVNLVRNFNIFHTQVNKNDPWTGILAAASFVMFSINNTKKGYSPGQLIFGCDMNLPIKHTLDQGLIRQRNQTQINKDNILKNRHRVDHKYKVRDNIILTKQTA